MFVCVQVYVMRRLIYLLFGRIPLPPIHALNGNVKQYNLRFCVYLNGVAIYQIDKAITILQIGVVLFSYATLIFELQIRPDLSANKQTNK